MNLVKCVCFLDYVILANDSLVDYWDNFSSKKYKSTFMVMINLLLIENSFAYSF